MKNLPLPCLARWSSAFALLAVLGTSATALAQPASAPVAPPVQQAAPKAVGSSSTPIGISYKEASDEQKNAARAAHKAGHTAQQDGNLDKALAHFREAHGHVSHPKMRLKIVRTLREMGRLGEAYDEARILISEADRAATTDDKLQQTSIDARDELRDISEQVGFLRLTKPLAPGSELRVNGRVIAPTAWSEPIAAKAGRAEVTVGKSKTMVDVVAGQEAQVALAAAAAEQPADSGGGGYDGPDRRLMAIIAGGVGVAGMTLFGILGAVSQGQFDRLESGCEDPDFCNPNLEPIHDRGVATQIGANVSLGIGLVGLAAGAGLFTWDLLDPAVEGAETAIRPTLVVGPSSVSIQGTF